MKKNAFKLALILFIGILTLEGCKKGENDPFLSLRSRDARITGEWKLAEYESTSINSSTWGGSTNTTTTVNKFDGTLWTWTSGGNTNSYSYSQTLTIEKDGTYFYKQVADGDTTEETGRWSWLSDAKNKTRILLDGMGIFYIDQLKNSEVVFTEETEDKDMDSDGNMWSSSFSSRAVYEKQ
jgi:hypothetical protein